MRILSFVKFFSFVGDICFYVTTCTKKSFVKTSTDLSTKCDIAEANFEVRIKHKYANESTRQYLLRPKDILVNIIFIQQLPTY